MEERQKQLLTLVIEHHIATAEPVGSKFLVEESNLDWSEATVRNELRALEEDGFLTHPHTSAGRIPTSAGYRFYVDNYDFTKKHLSSVEETQLKKDAENKTDDDRKKIAKKLAEISGETVIIAFSKNSIYYTGLSNLFQKPEFASLASVVNISSVFDHFEEVFRGFYEKLSVEPKYFIGKEHTFGAMLSVLAARFGKKEESCIVLLGPERMNYGKNFALMENVLENI